MSDYISDRIKDFNITRNDILLYLRNIITIRDVKDQLAGLISKHALIENYENNLNKNKNIMGFLELDNNLFMFIYKENKYGLILLKEEEFLFKDVKLTHCSKYSKNHSDEKKQERGITDLKLVKNYLTPIYIKDIRRNPSKNHLGQHIFIACFSKPDESTNLEIRKYIIPVTFYKNSDKEDSYTLKIKTAFHSENNKFKVIF